MVSLRFNEEMSKKFRSGFVPIIGRPNVGKSTLLNRILGRKVSITSPKPQTTWTRILGVKTREDGQIVFVDTPGFHNPRGNFNTHMVERAKESLREGDLILHLTDVINPFSPEEELVIREIKATKAPSILVINKIDLLKDPSQLKEMEEVFSKKHNYNAILKVSALKGENLDQLEEVIISLLPEGPPLFPEDVYTDQSLKTLAREIIREKVFHFTHQEVPYCCAVVVEEFREDPSRNFLYIQATINVERESQKGILIGKGGSMLKKIGSSARRELEELFGKKIYLDLWVKVQEDWRERDYLLRDFGLLK